MILISLIFVSITLLIVWLKWNYGFWRRHHVLGPEPSYLFGNVGSTLIMRKSLGQLVEDWYKKFSHLSYFGYYKMLAPAIVICDPQLAQNILTRDYANFSKTDFPINEKVDPLLARNPFLVDGEAWKRLRSVFSSLYTLARVKSLFALMLHSCQEMVNYIKELPTDYDVDAKKVSANFTTQNVVYCSFSIDAKCFRDKNSEFRVMGKKILQPSFWGGLKLLMVTVCPQLAHWANLRFIDSDVDQWIRNLVKFNIETRQKQHLNNEDLLQILLNTQEKYDLTNEDIAGLVLSMFVEGYETSSSTMSFILYEFAKSPRMQQNCYNEIVKVLAENNDEFSFQTLSEMRSLEYFLNEVMRIYFAVPLLPRICTREYTMPLLPGQKKPFIVKPGTPILLPAAAFSHDSRYFSEPQQIIPERFNEDNRSQIMKGTYLPFADGPRICPGMRFGLTQIKVAVVSLLRQYEIKLSPNCKPFIADPRSLIYQSINPLLINFVERK